MDFPSPWLRKSDTSVPAARSELNVLKRVWKLAFKQVSESWESDRRFTLSQPYSSFARVWPDYDYYTWKNDKFVTLYYNGPFRKQEREHKNWYKTGIVSLCYSGKRIFCFNRILNLGIWSSEDKDNAFRALVIPLSKASLPLYKYGTLFDERDFDAMHFFFPSIQVPNIGLNESQAGKV